jgi:hypothetical protein
LPKPLMSDREHALDERADDLSPEDRRIAEGKPTARASAIAARAVREAKAKPASALKAKPIQRNEFNLVESKQNDWSLVASHGAQPEDYDLKPEMWTMVSDMVTPYDTVRVIARDETWWALYLVIEAGTSRANAKLLMATEVPPKAAVGSVRDLPAGYDVRAGDAGQDPWIVVRLSDGFIMNMAQGHRSYEDARRWLLDHAVMRSDNAPRYYS